MRGRPVLPGADRGDGRCSSCWVMLRACWRRRRDLLRRPEVLVFLPALTLASFWLGGEAMLTIVALGLPMVFADDRRDRAARQLGRRCRRMPPMASPPGRSVTARLDEMLRLRRVARDDDGLPASCSSTMPNGCSTGTAARRRPRCWQRSADRMFGVLRQGDTLARLEGGGFAVALGAGAPARPGDRGPDRRAPPGGAVAPRSAFDAAQLYVTCSVGFCLGARAPQSRRRVAARRGADRGGRGAAQRSRGDPRLFPGHGAQPRRPRGAARRTGGRAGRRAQIRAAFPAAGLAPIPARSAGSRRWRAGITPSAGLSRPAEFLPAIDDAGLTERLGEVMLYQRADGAGALGQGRATACRRSSVNFSAAELRNPQLAEKLKWELDRFELAPDRLTVEILETVVAEADNDVIVSQHRGTRRAGLRHRSGRFRHRPCLDHQDPALRAAPDEDRPQLRHPRRRGPRTAADGLGDPVDGRTAGPRDAGRRGGDAGRTCDAGATGLRPCAGLSASRRPMPFEETADWILRHRARQAAAPRINHRAG